MSFTKNSVGVRATHDEICEIWYRISREDVEWVLEKCSGCALDENTKAGGIEIRSLLEHQNYNLENVHIATATLIKFAQKILY